VGKNQEKAFYGMKTNIIQAPFFTLPNLQNPFNMETHASGYSMGVVLMQGGGLIFYHFEVFHGVVINYPTYDKDIYTLVQAIKKWKNYLMGKDTIIHIDHQTL
jgi:hypothetical protein